MINFKFNLNIFKRLRNCHINIIIYLEDTSMKLLAFDYDKT